jgi:ATP-binding cassette subfamily B protein
MAAEKYTNLTILRRLFLQAGAYRLHIAGIFLLGLLAAPLSLLLPVPLKIVVDSVLGSDPLPAMVGFFIPESTAGSKAALLLLAVAMQVLVVMLIHVESLGNYVLQTYTGERLTLIFRESLFRQVQRLSFSFHDSRGTADSIYRIQYDAPSIQYILIYGMIPLASGGLTFLSMIYVTARINLQLALVALAVSPFLFLLTRMYVVRMRHRYINMKEMQSRTLNIVQEVMTAFRVVTAFGREESERERFRRHSGKTIRARVGLSFIEGSYGLIINTGIALGTAAVLFIGIRNVQAGVLTLGELLMVLAYVTQLYGPLRLISDKISSLQDSFASAQRSFELLDEIPDVVELPNARPLARAKGDVEFRGVHFAYDKDNAVLRDMTFHIPTGMRVGIAGKTGAGKTTLVSLLTRFYDCDSGSILLDGVDIRRYRLADLRNQFAIVLQDPLLFSTSIAENISYARPGAGKEEIMEAAKAANAHEFIAHLPEGYETLVGERGMRLSGGERQRIALARAFLKDAPILILDEPTSSVDTGTEAGIMESMERLMEGRSTFLITHRMDTLKNCDILLVIEQGRQVALTSDVTKTIKEGIPSARQVRGARPGREDRGSASMQEAIPRVGDRRPDGGAG